MVPFFIHLNDHQDIEKEQSFCPLKMTTGFPCPSCGVTKSMVYFFDGDLAKSIKFHILGPVVVIFSVGMMLLFIIELIWNKNFSKTYLYNRKLAYFLGSLLLFYHLIRLTDFVKNHTFEEIKKESIWK